MNNFDCLRAASIPQPGIRNNLFRIRLLLKKSFSSDQDPEPTLFNWRIFENCKKLSYSRSKTRDHPQYCNFIFIRNSGDAPGGLRDWARVHLRHQEAAAHDNLGGRQGAHSDLPQLTRRAGLWRWIFSFKIGLGKWIFSFTTGLWRWIFPFTIGLG